MQKTIPFFLYMRETRTKLKPSKVQSKGPEWLKSKLLLKNYILYLSTHSMILYETN